MAGLRRGVTVAPTALDAQVAREVTRLVQTLFDRPVRRVQGKAIPDQQTLTVRLASASGVREASFDTADLPEELVALKRHLPRLKPIPY